MHDAEACLGENIVTRYLGNAIIGRCSTEQVVAEGCVDGAQARLIVFLGDMKYGMQMR